jgi:hypothetical protein
LASNMVRESVLEETWKEIRVGKLALIIPVRISTEGRCVASSRWMPAALANLWARRVRYSSTSLEETSIRQSDMFKG